MPDTFVAPPGWSWDIVLYFFFGGIAGGIYFLASLLRLVGRRADRPPTRIGYYLALPLVVACALLLIKDLGRPGRFWHMVFQSEEFPGLLFKWWSPISFGVWVLLLFGLLALLSFLHALVEGGLWDASAVRRFTAPLHDPDGLLGQAFLIVATVWGLVLGGYTGMLAMVSNAPTWSRDPLLAPVFMASGVATGAAVVFLVAYLARAGDAAGRHRVLRTGALALAFDVVLVVATALLKIGGVSPIYMGWWAALFWIVILPIGLLVPLALLLLAEYRGRELVRAAPVVGAVLVLFGGLLFRVFEVFGGQAYFRPY